MEMKMRTIIVIDTDTDIHDMEPQEFARLTQEQIVNGELYVDEFMDMSDETTIVCIPMEPSDA